jgi:GNAT superfamily N-acetyltransferase
MGDEVEIRRATPADRLELLALAAGFATSFTVEKSAFEESLAEVLNSETAFLGVAVSGGGVAGYVLGYQHPAFYANGRVAWVEEIVVAEDCRRSGIGSALMRAFEEWASGGGAVLVALATRRAASFYQALGYEESATYFRKLL